MRVGANSKIEIIDKGDTSYIETETKTEFKKTERKRVGENFRELEKVAG